MPDRESRTDPIVIYEEIFPGETNSYGTAFGGKILALMDRAAGLASSRFACCNFVTASLDAIGFYAPVKQGEIAEVEARVVYTSPHTCGVMVNVYSVEKTEWKRRPCCDGTLFMVAIGPDGKPVTIPQMTPRTDEEKAAWARAEEVKKYIKKR